MVLPDQLLGGVLANLAKFFINKGDIALHIGNADNIMLIHRRFEQFKASICLPNFMHG